ncbi:MAG: GINS complex subunit Sld5 [Pyrobaculum sp.]|jgi:DNA replication factor GINS
MVFRGVVDQQNVRVVFQRDVNISMFGISQRAGSVSELPLSLALRLEDMGAVTIDESQLIDLKEISQLNFLEEKDAAMPAKLPEGFYARLKLTLYILNKRGDLKKASDVLNGARELVIKRIRKISVLVAAQPSKINDLEFLDRLTKEERALLTSLYSTVASFTSAIF